MTTEKRRNQHKIEPREIYGTSLRRKPLDSSVFVTELASNKFHFAVCSNFRKPHENVPGVFFGTRKRSGNNLESHGRRSSDGPVGSDHNFNSWNLLAWRMGFFLKLYLYVICTVRSSHAFSFICSNSTWSLKVTCVTSVLAPLSRARKHQRPAPPPLPSPPKKTLQTYFYWWYSIANDPRPKTIPRPKMISKVWPEMNSWEFD